MLDFSVIFQGKSVKSTGKGPPAAVVVTVSGCVTIFPSSYSQCFGMGTKMGVVHSG